MSEENENKDDQNQNDNSNTNTGVTEEQILQRIKDAVATELKDIKEKLNKAYAERDKAVEQVKGFEKQLKDIEVERLKDAGKVKEALELENKTLAERLESLEKANTELTRDSTVRGALAGLTFNSERASDMMFADIVKELVRDEKGVWKHRSGNSISEAVKLYAEDEANGFLFKKENSSGPGIPKTKQKQTTPQKLSERTQEEVLALISEGKLTRQR